MLALAWTAWALLSSRGSLAHAQDTLTEATRQEDPAAMLSLLAQAEEQLARADRRLSGLGPRVVEHVPIAGRTPRAVRLSTQAALAAVRAGRQVVTQTTAADLLVDGRIDLRALEQLEASLLEAAHAVSPAAGRLQEADTELTPEAVSSGVRAVRSRVDGLALRLETAAGGVEALAGLAGRDGPRRLLLVVENNAELRGLGGLVTVFAEGSSRDGKLEIGTFRDVVDVADAPPDVRRVPAPQDYRDLWGRYLANTTLWKNVNMTADGPTASAVLSEVAGVSLAAKPDAVVWFDVRTIAGLLGATGPATLPDGTVLDEENAVRVLLSDVYREAVDDSAGQAARRAALRSAADNIARNVLGSSPPTARLAEALSEAAAGRHLVVWSARPAEQEQLQAAGLAGHVQPRTADLASFFVQNLGGGDRDGNKLDYYGRRQVSVRVVVDRDWATVEQDVAVRNIAPPSGLPRYVAGQVTPGASNLLVTHALPREATLLNFARGGRDLLVAPQPRGQHDVVQDVISIPPGATVNWTLRYRLPLEDGSYTSTLFPQPLAVDAGLLVEVRPAKGLTLEVPPDQPLTDGDVLRISGPFAEVRSVAATATTRSRLRSWADSVRRFWNEPVRLP